MLLANLSLPNILIDCTADNNVDSLDLTDETKELLLELKCSMSIIALTTQPDSFIRKNKNPYLDTELTTEKIDLGWKKTGDGFADWEADGNSVNQLTHNVSDNFSTDILGEDDVFSQYTWVEKIVGKATRNRFLLPLDDSGVMFEDDKQAARFLKDLKLEEGKAFPINYNTDFNMLTDESFSRIFFYGMGAVLLAKQEEVSDDSEHGPFVVDMPLQELEVRSLYREYGARIHFSADQKVTAIYDYKWGEMVKPGDEGWHKAKMLAKVTAFLLMTAREHLVWSHLICSNDATREMTMKLAPSHPIRRLLSVFTFHATEVNVSAFDMLVPNTSLLHRSAGLKYQSMLDVFDMAYTESNVYEPFSSRTYNPALQKLADEGKFPYITEGSEFYDVVRTFVRSWLLKAGDAATDEQATAFYEGMKESSKGQKYELPEMASEDAMANVLSTIIFTVTGYHELIGHVLDYTSLPSRAGFRLTKKDPSAIDLQSFGNTAIIGASTSVGMPKLMSEFSAFFGKGGAPDWEVAVWKKFQVELEKQSQKVQAADKKRPVEFKYFDPKEFECSISV